MGISQKAQVNSCRIRDLKIWQAIGLVKSKIRALAGISLLPE
jgi:hypothetical protein